MLKSENPNTWELIGGNSIQPGETVSRNQDVWNKKRDWYLWWYDTTGGWKGPEHRNVEVRGDVRAFIVLAVGEDG